MMKHVTAFFIKLITTIILLGIVLGLFFGVSFGTAIIIGIILSAIGFIGDMFVLPKTGNILAAVGDLILTFLIVWFMCFNIFDDGISLLSAAFLSSLFIGASELYFHRYLRDHLFFNVDQPNNYTHVNKLQTEFSEDFDAGMEENKENKNA